jgi:hypothetical protein
MPENDSGANKTAMLGGILVTEEVYEYHQREIYKLVKERDRAEQHRDLYRGLSICLLGALIIITVLQWLGK